VKALGGIRREWGGARGTPPRLTPPPTGPGPRNRAASGRIGLVTPPVDITGILPDDEDEDPASGDRKPHAMSPDPTEQQEAATDVPHGRMDH
jgi:hypothetical protein